MRIVLNDHISGYEELLHKNNDIYNHHKNTQMLMTELYKTKNKLAPPIIDSTLNKGSIASNFRNLQKFQSERKKNVFYGLEALNCRSTQLSTL